ncbi:MULTISPECIES: TetR/AcrR family transcriptional regulator [Gordonia]|uniref:TetR family transcriptional regulator n=2 Tax=Gordonia alkanivorans TaxID=84096 RepID=W9DHN6_9ACTN|nr:MULTISPECIES: TetR/AcrR family transcriptional regulator [Gordonia]ETA05946.1 TetR family transcriptional regulator [Gordonia alkanivorans CGMCC 6845]MDH3009060.1 TetR/AcrR family transcriptional regulator [Gordonia alkanivorans]MDH3012913.1 TetR/AcrR family transcriptional regulator [Gordonia alkanivorans]MDH3018007.1 TetR/AcrR family transcriptional regulator [Gordonia alkanivorans]MDH3043367.1 TetR/AcrR family transcriptional regulator [Gordonia alkanivorans]
MAPHSAESVISGSDERGPRERMIVHAADLIGRDGVAATSIGDVISASAAPRGSIYHHFPGGKTQLMTEAVQYAGDFIAERLARRVTLTPAETVREIGGVWRRMLVNTDFQFGCPVMAGGLARRGEPEVADAAAEILRRWADLITARLVVDGVDSERADSLANLIVAAIEGAVALCQTQRSVEPLDRVIAELAALCDAAVYR